MPTTDQLTDQFEAERPRLIRIATRILGSPHAAEDVVQQAWIRLHGTTEEIENLSGWLTTVTSRLCLDQLRMKTPEPVEAIAETADAQPDPAGDVALADTVGIALQVVLDRLTPSERVAFVLHDSFGFGFPLIASMLGTTNAAARKLASRARGKVAAPPDDALSDWGVVDAFLLAAREGEFTRLLELLAPGAIVDADAAAIASGTPSLIEGADQVAQFFNGAAKTAFPAFVEGRPGAAWIHRGEARVAFDFTVVDGKVERITFRASDDVLASVTPRKDGVER
jgi:RNA polymerase sigma-70 factor (ECF subfamily)